MTQYVQHVINEANHHAQSVNNVILTAYGCLTACGGKILKHREKALWFSVNNRNYFINYNHQTGKINCKDKTQRGKVIFDFDNNTPQQVILDNFKSL